MEHINDAESLSESEVKQYQFTEESIRKGFLRKVYGILSVRKKKFENCFEQCI